MALVGALFFLFGFVTWLNGPLIGFVKLAFELDEVGAFLVPMVFYLSYFFLALPSSWVLARTGMKRGMAVGLAVMALGALGFGETVARRWYAGALTSLFTLGGGLSLLQTAVNPYVTILGPHASAARRIAIMGICNKLGGLLAPLVLGAFVLRDLDALSLRLASAAPADKAALLGTFAASVQTPYRVAFVALAVLAAATLRSPLPDLGAEPSDRSGARELFRVRRVWLGAATIFFYVGVEVMAGDAIGSYGRSFGLPLDATKFFTSLTLAAMLVGYVVGLAVVPRHLSQERYLACSAVLGLVLSTAAFATSGSVSVGLVAALGFANAMMWPAIFPLAIKDLGRLTEAASALLVMGIVGGAVLPQLFALGKDRVGPQLAFLALTAPAYLFILFFALRGHRTGAREPRAT